MRKLVVLSHPSVNLPHRKPYDILGATGRWEVHIVAPARLELGGGQFKECEPVPPGASYQLHELPLRLALTGRFSFFQGLAALLWKIRPHAVFAEYDPGTLLVLQSFLTGAPVGSKVIAYSVENFSRNRWNDAARNLAAGHLRNALRDAAVGSLDAAGARATSALACLNRDGEQIFKHERSWSKPLEIVPLGTNLELFHPTDERELRRSLGLDGCFVVGYFGRLAEEKGVHLLIEALSRLPAEVRVLLDAYKKFAPGDYASRLLERAQELGVRDRIVTFDAPHAEVPRYMSCCDVIVLPSLTLDRIKEQFGRTMPEAMACDVPVIGSRCGAIPEVIGDAGILIDQGSVDQLAEAIQELLRSPDRRAELLQKGRERVRQLWSAEVQAWQTERIIESALGLPHHQESRF